MKDKLNSIYNEINAKYKTGESIDEEKIKQDVESLNKQINGMKKHANNITDEKKKAEILAQIKRKEITKNNLEGYAKYNIQIDKIKSLKARMNNKLSRVQKDKQNATKTLNALESHFKKEKQNLIDLYIQNKPEKTTGLTNAEYDELQEKIKATKEKVEILKGKIDKQTNLIKSYDKKENELKGKIGKCDLAWKTLFTNKDWDEIQRRSLEDSKKYTKAKDIQKQNETQQTNNVEEQKETQQTDNKVEKSLAKVEKPSLFKRFTNFVKRTTNKVKNFFIEEEKKESISAQENTTVSKTTEQKTLEPKVTEQKDKFLEGLRFNVDLDYKRDVTQMKEQQYIEQHKSSNKKEMVEKDLDD